MMVVLEIPLPFGRVLAFPITFLTQGCNRALETVGRDKDVEISARVERRAGLIAVQSRGAFEQREGHAALAKRSHDGCDAALGDEREEHGAPAAALKRLTQVCRRKSFGLERTQ